MDIGCGYGFLSYTLGYTSAERTITGVDYDEEKIEVAQNGYLKGDNVNFVNADILTYQFEKQDAIVINDVLHYLPEKNQSAVLENCIENINPGGMIVIRDGAKELQKRHRGTRLTELFSTRILGFNKTGSDGLNFISSDLIKSIASKHQLELTVSDTSRFTSNLIFVLKKRPA